MTKAPILRVYLEGSMLRSARAGSFNFMAVLRRAVEGAGWQVEWHETGHMARMAAPCGADMRCFTWRPPRMSGR
ncbi:hypothetical protein ACFSS8_11740 [Paracoccus kondratievae]